MARKALKSVGGSPAAGKGATRGLSAADREVFVLFSSMLTGFLPVTLEGTGVVEAYALQLRSAAGKEMFGQLLEAARDTLEQRGAAAQDRYLRVNVWASPVLGPLVDRVVLMWYTGEWSPLDGGWYALSGVNPNPATLHGKVVSAEAYRGGLAWRVAGAHPPGAKPTGHGGWSLPPIVRDEDIPYPGGSRGGAR